jgi:hypothetical protein
MIALQYSFVLPANYDMEIIHKRVAENGHRFDNLPGLRFKTFLAASKGGHNKENLYAPFYVWNDNEGMNDFICGDKFVGLVESFGWPPISTWSVFDCYASPSIRSAKYAVREVSQILPFASLADVQRGEKSQVAAAAREGSVASVSAFEPRTWTLVRFSLWEKEPTISPAENTQVYRVLRVCAPQ